MNTSAMLSTEAWKLLITRTQWGEIFSDYLFFWIKYNLQLIMNYVL